MTFRPNSKTTAKFLLGCLLSIASVVPIRSQDLKAEAIIARNLDSIGSKEKRGEITTIMALGLSDFESKLPNQRTAGKFLIVSNTDNLFFVSSFNVQQYLFEKIGYFAGKVEIPALVSGTRSPLGSFIRDHNNLLNDGLFTGSVSLRWNPLSGKRKLVLDGTKKIAGRKAYVVNYYEKGSSSAFTIRLFFDAENFHHIRTEFRDVIAAKESVFGSASTDLGTESILTENFDDFRDESGLTLPHRYKIYFMSANKNTTIEYNWDLKVSEYRLNQRLAADFFKF